MLVCVCLYVCVLRVCMAWHSWQFCLYDFLLKSQQEQQHQLRPKLRGLAALELRDREMEHERRR